MDRLRGGKVGVQPKPVAGLQVGDRRDWQRDSGAGNVDFDPGADEVESGVVIRVGGHNSPEGDQNRAKRHSKAQARTTVAGYYPGSRSCDVWLQTARFDHSMYVRRSPPAARHQRVCCTALSQIRPGVSYV